jgi:hypothetical protein
VAEDAERAKLIRMEQQKVLSSWINIIAANIVAVGLIMPLAAYIYGINSPQIAAGVVPLLVLGWLACGVANHLAAEWVLIWLEP